MRGLLRERYRVLRALMMDDCTHGSGDDEIIPTANGGAALDRPPPCCSRSRPRPAASRFRTRDWRSSTERRSSCLSPSCSPAGLIGVECRAAARSGASGRRTPSRSPPCSVRRSPGPSSQSTNSAQTQRSTPCTNPPHHRRGAQRVPARPPSPMAPPPRRAVALRGEPQHRRRAALRAGRVGGAGRVRQVLTGLRNVGGLGLPRARGPVGGHNEDGGERGRGFSSGGGGAEHERGAVGSGGLGDAVVDRGSWRAGRES
ncbi:hypothetical protein B0H15DRAFT_560041 [Mycena belliarum]|uniref:Uncharacterized protein n=1 Tax=Mycena belliarum TaxID=1033014 RepID=A0AAD6XIV1_9AGAR|nr:hypothetical protein B0H15DRAFT_560041 [Mycena belliae]